eukprot:sb/3465328/
MLEYWFSKLTLCNATTVTTLYNIMAADGRPTGTFLERLEKGPVLCDGGFVFALEKRGYVEAGPWTPEAVCEHPEVYSTCQAFTFYASEDKLNNRGHGAGKHGVYGINKAACEIVKEVTYPEGGLVAGGLSQTPTYLSTNDKQMVKDEVKKQLQVFKEQNVDLMICEYYEHVEEADLAINEESDVHGVPTGECGVRLVRAGADVVGVNCHFDPFRCIAAVKKMIDSVKEAGLKAHYMVQPLGYWTPDAGVQGFIALPEFPFALEARIMTRFDMARYAREAWDAGIRFIGGCCGYEPYHIRAVSEELAAERGGYLPANCSRWGACLAKHTKPWVRNRANREYWENLNPSTGRPFSASLSKPSQWGITAGDDLLKQHTEETTEEELEAGSKFLISKHKGRGCPC